MIRWRCLLFFAVFMTACLNPAQGASAPDHPDIARLHWLTGDWQSDEDGRWSEEHWLPARGGAMLGLNRTGRGDRASGFEFMRIQADADGVLNFWGSPGGAPPVAFRLTGIGDQRCMFENPGHDFPKRIAYWREGDRLYARVDGGEGTAALDFAWNRH